MFPLSQRKLIRGCEAHIKAGLGCGGDWTAVYVDLFSPFSGKVETYFGTQGGNWIRLIRPNGDKIELAHLSKYLVDNGATVKAGQKIAITGNTGSITTNPHLHIQIIRDGKRIDPNAYNWEDAIIPPMNCEAEKQEIIRLNTEIGVVTKQRDDLKNALAVEKDGHSQTLGRLIASQGEVTALEEKMKANQTIIDNVRRDVAV